MLFFECRAEYMDFYGFDAGCPSTGGVNSMCNISGISLSYFPVDAHFQQADSKVSGSYCCLLDL